MSKLANDIAASLARPESLYGQVINIKNGIADIATREGLKSFTTTEGLKAGDKVMIKNNSLFPLSTAKRYNV